MSTEARFMGADGSVFAFASTQNLDLDPWDSSIAVTGALDGRSPDRASIRQLHVARRGNYDPIMERLHAEPTQRLSAYGGEIVVASSSLKGVQGVVFWRGPHHDVASYLPYSMSMVPTEALRPLAGLEFADSADGVVVRPAVHLGETVSVLSASTHIDGVGMLDLLPPERGISFLPSWAGAAVPVGEVWHTEVNESEYYILASDQGVALLTPSPRLVNARESVENFVSGLTALSVQSEKEVSV